MYSLLICLSILGSALGIPISNEVSTNDDARNTELASLYVLPGESFPTFYDVRLVLDPSNVEYFYGNVSIRVLTYFDTDEIVLHAMAMQIDNISVRSDRDDTEELFESYTLATDDTQILRIKMNRNLTAMQPHNVHINYVAQFAENMFGVYVSTYPYEGRTVNLITSQLQPTYARRAFPCYDEPALKAVFRTTIYAPAAFPVVRSNTIERTDNLKSDIPGYIKYEFEDTLVMSTYLLAYLVSEFSHIDNEANPIFHAPFKVFSRPGTQESAAFALEFGQDNMVALEEYTEFKYEFPKMDKAAVPDFAAGAMENWGLVIYREVALLVTEGVTTTTTKQNIGRIICHENVHQWFGNEVGPLSWTYTWLNEGFANFFEAFGTDLVLPGWRMMDQFVITTQNVFQSDAVLTINPMTHPVFTPSQILSTFNAVAYQKSGAVIRMMHHFLTPEIFRQGLVIYIKENTRSVAAPASLYSALQQALDQSNHSIPYALNTVMTRWENQGGFPVLTVRRTAPTADSVFVAQERYLTDNTLTSNDRWHVPVNWVLSTNVNFSDTRPQGWVPPTNPAQSFDIPGLSQAQWFIFNKQQTGYYRVNYDEDNWQALANVLNSSHNTIHLLNRAQIIDDSFNLARNGRLNYRFPLDISRYMIDEKDYVPWASLNAAFNYLEVVLSGSDVYDLYQKYVLHLSAPLYEELGFDALSGEEHVAPYHRNIILNANCRLGNDACIQRAQELLQEFRNNPSQRLNPDIQTTVYCSGLRGGDEGNFNFLWDQYLSSTDSSEQTILLNALGCTSNAALRNFYMGEMISDTSAVRDQDRHTVLVAIINSGPESMDAALDFIVEHFAEIQPRVQGLTGTTNILNAFASRLTTEEHGRKIDEFVSRYASIMTAGEQASVNAIRTNIDASITWNNDNFATVASWLRDNYGDNDDSSAGIVTSSFIIVISVMLAIFNL